MERVSTCLCRIFVMPVGARVFCFEFSLFFFPPPNIFPIFLFSEREILLFFFFLVFDSGGRSETIKARADDVPQGFEMGKSTDGCLTWPAE